MNMRRANVGEEPVPQGEREGLGRVSITCRDPDLVGERAAMMEFAGNSPFTCWGSRSMGVSLWRCSTRTSPGESGGPLHGASLGSSPPAVRPGTQGTPLMGGSDVLEAGGEKWGGGNRPQCSEHLREWYLS